MLRKAMMLLVVLAMLAALSGCSANPMKDVLIGKWSGIDNVGDSGSFQFRDDNTVTVAIDGQQKDLFYSISGEDYPAMILLSEEQGSDSYYSIDVTLKDADTLEMEFNGEKMTMQRE